MIHTTMTKLRQVFKNFNDAIQIPTMAGCLIRDIHQSTPKSARYGWDYSDSSARKGVNAEFMRIYMISKDKSFAFEVKDNFNSNIALIQFSIKVDDKITTARWMGYEEFKQTLKDLYKGGLPHYKSDDLIPVLSGAFFEEVEEGEMETVAAEFTELKHKHSDLLKSSLCKFDDTDKVYNDAVAKAKADLEATPAYKEHQRLSAELEALRIKTVRAANLRTNVEREINSTRMVGEHKSTRSMTRTEHNNLVHEIQQSEIRFVQQQKPLVAVNLIRAKINEI